MNIRKIITLLATVVVFGTQAAEQVDLKGSFLVQLVQDFEKCRSDVDNAHPGPSNAIMRLLGYRLCRKNLACEIAFSETAKSELQENFLKKIDYSYPTPL